MTNTTTRSTQYALSADGTEIAFEVSGSGPALVLVDGAMCQRAMGPSRGLAKQLEGSFTVYAYDRRGRGDSGAGASPYAMKREVEDLRCVLEAAGGNAHVLGVSSGAVLALEAARQGAGIGRIVAYEAPFILDDTKPGNDPALPQQVQTMVDQGRRGEAVKTFLRLVGVPAPVLTFMPLLPAWKKMTGVAHTLPYDLTIVIGNQQGEPLPTGYYDGVTSDTLVIAGGKSPAYMQNAQAAIAAALPRATVETLAGQTHMVKAKVVAPAVIRHLLERHR